MKFLLLFLVVASVLHDVFATEAATERGHRRHRHHHRHGHVHEHHRRHHHRHERGRVAAKEANATESTSKATIDANGTASLSQAKAQDKSTGVGNSTAAEKQAAKKRAGKEAAAEAERNILGKMKVLENELDAKAVATKTTKASKTQKVAVVAQKSLEVNGPLPPDFSERFSAAVAEATGSDPARVKVIKAKGRRDGTFHLIFQAPLAAAEAVQEQAADPDSRLANGPLHEFLVAKEATHSAAATPEEPPAGAEEAEARGKAEEPRGEPEEAGAKGRAEDSGEDETEPQPGVSTADLPMQRGVDVDTQMPYGELEPFGREDTAQELTERSISESNEMVDQLERAEVAEEKRAVFRALTRLRGAALTAFDGIARAQTGTIDKYNKLHKWRAMHPLHQLANEEADVSKWAFPDF
mmetsp:Transcript_66332/g.160395  ORF Transcript_66332/g.160395 Transcript_66332/m.160395 type:complete len:412 (-) Transcript_66332:29-1264(-)